jgi:hypothetical protein
MRGLQPPETVRLHRRVRLDQRVLWSLGPPRQRYDDAALEVATGLDNRLAALGVLANAVQQRRTTARRLLESLDARPRAAMRDWLEGVLVDIAGGTCSVLEHAFLTDVERAHLLPVAERQVRATASVGLVYRDATYAVGQIVELDGRLFHDSASQRDLDLERDLDAAIDGLSTLRLGWGQVFDRPCSTAAKLARLLTLRGWTGTPVACGPGCAVARQLGRAG